MPDVTPYRNFNFVVEVDGLPSMNFEEVVIPGSRIEVIEYRDGSDPASGTRKIPGRWATGNVVLRRGIDNDLALWNWSAEVRHGVSNRREVDIVIQDAERNELRRWRVSDAWPAAYEFSPLEAQGNEVVIETIELACERVDVLT